MAMKALVTRVNGEIVAETRSGVRHFHAHDAKGNTIALYDDAGTKTDTYSYWPYGAVRTRTGTTVNPYQYSGAWGCYKDSTGRTYMQARTLRHDLTRWVSIDPLWPDEMMYSYVNGSPTSQVDPTGMSCKMKVSDIKVKIRTWPRCTARCVKDWWDPTSWSCGKCNYDLNTLMEITAKLQGCRNCKFFQWVSRNGSAYRRDSALGWPYPWDCHGVGKPWGFCNTNDNPFDVGNFVPCAQYFSVDRDFIACVCCTGFSACFKWGAYHSADGCAPFCDHWGPSWMDSSASTFNCTVAAK